MSPAPERPSRKHDRAIIAPGRAAALRHVADVGDRSARYGDFLELSVREETDPFPIGREERISGAVSTCDGSRLQLIERPHEHARLIGAFRHGDEGDDRPVGRRDDACGTPLAGL
jgi:hypothetical protein